MTWYILPKFVAKKDLSKIKRCSWSFNSSIVQFRVLSNHFIQLKTVYILQCSIYSIVSLYMAYTIKLI